MLGRCEFSRTSSGSGGDWKRYEQVSMMMRMTRGVVPAVHLGDTEIPPLESSKAEATWQLAGDRNKLDPSTTRQDCESVRDIPIPKRCTMPGSTGTSVIPIQRRYRREKLLYPWNSWTGVVEFPWLEEKSSQSGSKGVSNDRMEPTVASKPQWTDWQELSKRLSALEDESSRRRWWNCPFEQQGPWFPV
jgi:hypothetical protein